MKKLLSNQFGIQLKGHLFARRYRMTFVIGIEAIIFAFLLITIMPEVMPISVTILISAGIILSILNLVVLKKYHCVFISSYFLTTLIYIITIVVNLIEGGAHTSNFIWLYLIPITAATITGFRGLFIFGGLSILTILGFLFFPIEPIFHPAPDLIWYIQLMNYGFSMLLTLSVLTAFLIESLISVADNRMYTNKKLLKEENKTV